MNPHAFVVMPFGIKPDANGKPIDFNRVYAEYIAPALRQAGLDVFRADQEQRAGNIIPDMFQELLIADLVVADLSINNPNVWYELGVRHGLRARGVILVCGGEVTSAFDLYTDRKLRYGLRDGAPDPLTLEVDRAALAAMATATVESWHGRKLSPVYYHLPNLKEPDWKSLKVGDVREFWDRHEEWSDRIDQARQAQQTGDLLVLADEAPIAAFRAEAWITAGQALRRTGHFRYALEQLARGLAVDGENLVGLREKGICLQRLAMINEPGHTLDRARKHYEAVLARYPDDAETWALKARVDKDAWTGAWRSAGSDVAACRAAAIRRKGLLRTAIESYREGYSRNPAHFFSGINALSLSVLQQDLIPGAVDEELPALAGAVRYAALNNRDPTDEFHAHACLGDLEVLFGDPPSVTEAYEGAIDCNRGDWFALDSCRQQLLLLQALGFKPDNVAAGIAALERALAALSPPAAHWTPRKVFLFSGHMVDEPSRPVPRFPNDERHIEIAAQAIAAALREFEAGPEDLGLTQGACGGDLLFTDACLAAGVPVQWLQPFDEPQFIQHSVARGGEPWRRRYREARDRLMQQPRYAPDALGAPPADAPSGYAYERANRWLLYTAIGHGTQKTCFICLWDGKPGDGAGGTGQMLEEVSRRTGNVRILQTETLW